MSRPTRALALLAALLTFTSACIQVSRTGRAYPQAPADASQVLYVAADGDALTADGSPAAPYASLTQALDAASDGTALLLAAGDYPEVARIDRSVIVRGLTGTRIGVDVAAISVQVGPNAKTVRLEDLTLHGGTDAVLLVSGAKVTVARCTVDAPGDTGSYAAGIGVAALDGADVTLEDSTVQNAAGPGVVARSASLKLVGTTVTLSLGGGVFVQWATSPVLIDRATISFNDGFGLAIMSSAVVVARSTIERTGDRGDGILVGVDESEGSVPSSLRVGGPEACAAVGAPEGESCGNLIDNHARFGVFIDAAAGGVIADNQVSRNTSGGIWVQRGDSDTISIRDNVVSDNSVLGVGLAAGVRGEIVGNLIEITAGEGVGEAGKKPGDGVTVINGASAFIDGNIIRSSERAAIFLSHIGADTTLGTNTFEDNLQEILLQGEQWPRYLLDGGAPAAGGPDALPAAVGEFTEDATEEQPAPSTEEQATGMGSALAAMDELGSDKPGEDEPESP